MARFDRASKILFRHEGGYVNNPVDPGGPTNYGVSLRFLRSQNLIDGDFDHDGDIDQDDIKSMTIEQAMEFYKVCFWDKYLLEKISPQIIANILFGMIVNTGPKTAIKNLQETINKLIGHTALVCDGKIGKRTLELINIASPYLLLGEYKKEMKKFYTNLVENNKKLSIFLKGWFNRLDSYE